MASCPRVLCPQVFKEVCMIDFREECDRTGASRRARLVVCIALLTGPPALAAQAGAELLAGLGRVYGDLDALRQTARPVVCVLDTQHPDIVRKELGKAGGLDKLRTRIHLELAGIPSLVVHYTQVEPTDMQRPAVKAVVVLSRNRRISLEWDEKLFALLRALRSPTLAISGGSNLLVSAYGGKTGPMRMLGSAERDPHPTYQPGRLKEWGPTQLTIERDDPIFSGLRSPLSLNAYHAWEIKTLPASFKNLASSPVCTFHVAKHGGRPVYAVQASVTQYSEAHPDARELLRNFFGIAGIDVARRTEEALASRRAEVLRGIESLFAPPRELRSRTTPFVCFIHTEHPDKIRGTGQDAARSDHGALVSRWRERVELDLAGLPCLVVHYTQVKCSDFANDRLRAILISGRSSPMLPVFENEVARLIRTTSVPTIGFCGGHQLIASAYGVRVAAMRRLRPGESDPAPHHGPGFFKEWGFLPVRIVSRDPVFDHLPDVLMVAERHYAEAKEVPQGFELLASSDTCRVQALKHKERLLYGTQFHPEAYRATDLHGRTLLRNFFRLAGMDVNRQLHVARQRFVAQTLRETGTHYRDFHDLEPTATPCLCIIDTQHPDLIRKRRSRHFAALKAKQTRLAALSGLPCKLIHCGQTMASGLPQAPIRALIISTRTRRLNETCDRELFHLIRTTQLPILGISGGHQVVAGAFGCRVSRMKAVDGDRGSGTEKGFVPVRVLRQDRIFAGLGREFTVPTHHSYEVSDLAEPLETLATTEACKVQILKHRDRPVYGVQFDPTRYDEAHPDGKTILLNFLRMACEE